MRLRLAAVLLALLLAASFASAQGGLQTVLAPDSTLYAIDASQPRAQLELSRRRGDLRETLVVPGTDDEAIESEPRLVYDAPGKAVYVLWHRAAEGIDEIRLAALNGEGDWSDVEVVAGGATVSHVGLQLALTHAREQGDESDTTLIHVAWWSIGAASAPEYAVVAFVDGRHLSTEVANLETLLADANALRAASVEETGHASHPPLVMSRAGKGVDVVFGERDSTSISHVRIEPRPIFAEARIWRPVGRTIQQTGPAKLISQGTAPVQAFIAGVRVVLYTPDRQFRYIVFDHGQWSPIGMIMLDENVTSEHVLQELRQTVEEEGLRLDAPTQAH